MSTLTKSMAEKSVTVRQKLTTVSITLPDSDLNIFQQFLHRWHKLRFMSAPLNPGGGGGSAIYGYIGMCRCEGYGFQAVYSRIGYVNQSVWFHFKV